GGEAGRGGAVPAEGWRKGGVAQGHQPTLRAVRGGGRKRRSVLGAGSRETQPIASRDAGAGVGLQRRSKSEEPRGGPRQSEFA
ncbi:unnamed protein product, partial [Bubo scandiacus]